jgi:Fur family zinc uptake transcriptional regulator
VAEIPAAPIRAALDAQAGEAGFHIERTSLEAVGLCPACMKGGAA